jgi:hypothetical protein
MNDVIIVDSFLHKMAQVQMEKLIIHDSTADWHYSHYTTFGPDVNELQFCQHDPDIMSKRFGIFTHFLVDNDNIKSDIQKLLPDFKTIIENKFNIKIKSILQSRIQFKMPTGEVSNKYGAPHGDLVYPKGINKYKTIIYYINDSDGDTIMFDEFAEVDPMTDLAKKTLMQRISPKRGRAIMFDSNRYHAGSFPSKDIRLVLNIVTEIED